MTHSLTELINDEGVCRTAPATPGLLKTHNMSYNVKTRGEQASGSVFHPPDESVKNYCGFLDLLGAIRRLILKDRFHVVHMNYW